MDGSRNSWMRWAAARWLLVAALAVAGVTVAVIRAGSSPSSEERDVRAVVVDYLGDIARGAGGDACRDLSSAGAVQLRRLARVSGVTGGCAAVLSGGWALITAQRLRPVRFLSVRVRRGLGSVRVVGSDDVVRLRAAGDVWRIESLPLENTASE